MVFSHNDKDKASGEKKHVFFLTEVQSEFYPFLYQQVGEPQGVESITSLPYRYKERPGNGTT